MSAAPLPAVEQWLTALIPRVRALRLAHGASRLVAAALGTASAVLLLDAGAALPPWARGLFLSVWLTTIGVLAWRWVFVPWRSEVPLADVAREVEKQFPELGERLISAVGDDSAGPPAAVRAAMVEDTARRIRGIDGPQAVPVTPALWPTVLAASALLAAAATTVLVPGTGERLRRVAAPWHRPTGAPFRVVVTSGEPVVRRGGSVTLSAYAERAGGAHGPADAVLVCRAGPEAPDARLPMAGDGAAFHATRVCVTGDFEYRVEIDGATSEWFRVTALDPVEPADGTRVEIAAPAYTRRSKRVLPAPTDFEGFQYGTATFQLKFTLPAASAHFDWRPEGATKSELIALDLAPDRRGATAALPLRGSGVLRLVLVREENGKRLRTDTAMTVRVATDEPPWFEEVSGAAPRPVTVRPGARVPIAFVARDDVSASGAVLEYVTGPDDTRAATVPIALTGAGTPRAVGRIDFAPPAALGETVRFRIRVTDNRAPDDPKLAPQEVAYPPGAWCELKIDPAAPPLDQQEIAAQHAAVGDALAAAGRELKGLGAEAAALRAETAGAAELAFDKKARLNNACETFRDTVARVHTAARDAALAPDLRPLAAALRDTDPLFKSADAALRSAETDDPPARAAALTAAGARLAEAEATLTDLGARSARLGRARLDRARLTALAADQALLAGGGADRGAVQRELRARLAALLSESEALRTATAAAKGEEVRRLAAAGAELAARLRALDAAAKRSAAGARAALVAAIAHDQDALGTRAAALFARLDAPARLAGCALPAPDDFLRVAELAAAGKTVEALTELEKNAQALERIAAAFDRWGAERADPKLAAKQLALWQDDLRARLLLAAKTGFDKVPDEAKGALRAEQKALHAAVEGLALPPDDDVKAIRTSAARHAALANERLSVNGDGADEAMKLSADALARLAERTPTVPGRLTATLRAVEALRQELDATGSAVEQVLKNYDRPDALTGAALARKLGPHADKVRRLVPRAAALDLPGLTDRRTRAVRALATAAADMRDGSLLDVPASLGWARREFERLNLVLRGDAAPDARAEELHAKLAALGDALDAHGPKITRSELEPALPVLQEVQRQLGPYVAPEAPALLNDARAAVLAAESAVRDPKSNPVAARTRVRAATVALARLADRLDGFESDHERLGRLAGTRRLAFDRAVESAKKPPNTAASEEAGRQLNRETDELTNTRVGAVNQMAKQRALRLYAALRAKADSDRQAGDQMALAEALDELAARTADLEDLTAVFDRPAPPAPSGADPFLPSKPLADALRDLTRQQRATHARVTNFALDLADRLRPTPRATFAALEAKQRALAADVLALAQQVLGAARGAAHPARTAAEGAADEIGNVDLPAATEKAQAAANFLRQFAERGAGEARQKAAVELVARQDDVLRELTALSGSNAAAALHLARTEELARLAGAFAARLELAAQTFDPGDATGAALTAAARSVAGANTQLAGAAKKTAAGAAADAEGLRAAADARLRTAADEVSAVTPAAAPAAANVASGLAVRSAERAMRRATDALVAGDAPGAEAAMRDAATALREAARAVDR